MNPGDVPFDDRRAPAGRVVFLVEMLVEQAAAEIKLVPGDLRGSFKVSGGLAASDQLLKRHHESIIAAQ